MSDEKYGPDAPTKGGVDWMLQNMVLHAGSGVEMGVTLTFHGMIISGNVISGRRYAELLGEQGDVIGIGDYYRDYAEPLSNIDAGEGEGPHFIHLRDARMVVGGTVLPTSGSMLWRGKLSEVVGHIVGVLGRPATDD